MKKLAVYLFLAGILLSGLTAFGQEKREFNNYQEMRTYVRELFIQRKYAEAADILESVLDRFPENIFANSFNLATMLVLQGNIEKAMTVLEDGHRRGLFYGIWDFDGDMWEPLKKHNRFAAYQKENEARIAAAQKNAKMIVEVVTPEGYDPSKKYPLFIALHGAEETIALFKPEWVSPRLRKEFLTAYVQSSQVSGMRGFHWQDIAITKNDIGTAYRQILSQYPVNLDRILIGGFSSGGLGTMVVAFSDLIPARGFVVLCPEPPTLSDETISAAAKRGLIGSLLATEQDQFLDQQKGLVDRWKRLGLDAEIHITPDIGHWFPNNFAELLDRAIGRILGDGK